MLAFVYLFGVEMLVSAHLVRPPEAVFKAHVPESVDGMHSGCGWGA